MSIEIVALRQGDHAINVAGIDDFAVDLTIQRALQFAQSVPVFVLTLNGRGKKPTYPLTIIWFWQWCVFWDVSSACSGVDVRYSRSVCACSSESTRIPSKVPKTLQQLAKFTAYFPLAVLISKRYAATGTLVPALCS